MERKFFKELPGNRKRNSLQLALLAMGFLHRSILFAYQLGIVMIAWKCQMQQLSDFRKGVFSAGTCAEAKAW